MFLFKKLVTPFMLPPGLFILALLLSYVSHLKNLIVGFYTHIANNTSNLLILLKIKKSRLCPLIVL